MRSTVARLVLVASIIAGVSFIVSWSLPLTQTASLTWKGAGVGLLAVYAALQARGRDGWLLCAVMGFGALGDVLLGAARLIIGAVAFLVGHLFAIWLYLRHRRTQTTQSQRLLAICMVPAVVLIAYLLPADRAGAPGVAVYALFLSIMAAMAWTSRFPRYLVGCGAVMFVVSDLLIFGREGPLAGANWVGFAIWTLYYFGQLMICLGVTRTLVRTAPAT